MSESSPHPEQLDPGAEQGPWERHIQALHWLRSYRPSQVLNDGLAAGVLTVLLLPQALAYALLAELPPVTGLYAACVPALAYALFGTSRFVAVGPVALAAQVTAEAVNAHSSDSVASTEVALVLAALTGGLLILAGIAQLAQIADFVSRPVLDGFAAAVAVLIASSQLDDLLGADVDRAPQLAGRLTNLFSAEPHLPTVTLGVTALALLVGMPRAVEWACRRLDVPQRWHSPIARTVPLVVLGAVMWVTWAFGLNDRGVAVVGRIDVPWPQPSLPGEPLALARDLLPTAAILAVLIFVIGLAVARSLAEKDTDIDPNQEMLALGAANLGAAVVGGLPVGASVSRSSVSRDAGASTVLAVVLAGGLAITLATFTGPLLAYLPKTAMAALILSAIFGLVDLPRIRRTWRADRSDGTVLAVTFLAALVTGVEWGLAFGVLVSLIHHLWAVARPEVVVLGPSDDGGGARGARRDDIEEAFPSPVLVLRIDQQLFFGNASWVRQKIIDEILNSDEVTPRCLLFDLRSVNAVDVTAMDMLATLLADLEAAGFRTALAEAKEPIQAKLEGFLPENLPSEGCFVDVNDAVDVLCGDLDEDDLRVFRAKK